MTEAQVVYWLKQALERDGLDGQVVRDLLTDADGSYMGSPYRSALAPFGTVRIADRRPDLVGVLERQDAGWLVAFEVKALVDHDKGVVQVEVYRQGVHQAYLCIPEGREAPGWLGEAARNQGIGLITVSASSLRVQVPSKKPSPDPHAAEVTRRRLLGERSLRTFGLNKPLHYLAVAVARASPDPALALLQTWGLARSSLSHAISGAEALGLLTADGLTPRGHAYVTLLQTLGFSLASDRRLTRHRLFEHAPIYAGVLRTLLLEHPAVDLIERTLAMTGGRCICVVLARLALRQDEGMARAVFGDVDAKDWRPRTTTVYQLKAALYDTGLLRSRLAQGASNLADGRYDPANDEYELEIAR